MINALEMETLKCAWACSDGYVSTMYYVPAPVPAVPLCRNQPSPCSGISSAPVAKSQDPAPSLDGIDVEEIAAMEIETLTGERVWISVDTLIEAARMAQSLGA